MDIDVDVSRWIMEFVVSQPLEDSIFNAIISVLPLPEDDSRLTKSLILRKIDSVISNGSVSEEIIEFLELIEELDNQEGVEPSEALKSAYCAVAVDCTVKNLNDNDKGMYFEAVKRIWKQRINQLEKVVEKVGLVSEELWTWRDDIEAALWDDKCCDNVIRRSKSLDAVDAVKVFVKEAKERIGSSFLEVMAETLQRDDAAKAFLGGEPERRIETSSSAGHDLTRSNHDREKNKGNALRRRKHVAVKRTREAPGGVRRGVIIADYVEPGAEASHKQDDLLHTDEIKKAKEALRLSSLELRAVVKDPLPDALDFAGILLSMSGDNSSERPVENDSERAPHLVVDSSRVRANGGNEDNLDSLHHNAASKPSLMNRNSTAHRFEWDDSIDDLSEGSPSHGRSCALPSPRRIKVSPLKKYVFKNVSTRRKPKKWSTLEEDTLRAGVQKYGAGNWKLIFDAHHEIFAERTPVDLKDKWRNLTS